MGGAEYRSFRRVSDFSEKLKTREVAQAGKHGIDGFER